MTESRIPEPQMRVPYTGDDYIAPVPAVSDTQKLNRFIIDVVDPGMRRIFEQYAGCVSKSDLYNVSRHGQHLKYQIGDWIPLAQDLLTIAIDNETERAYIARAKDNAALIPSERMPAEVAKTQIKSRVSAAQRKIDTLKNAREELSSLIMSIQSALKTLSGDEIGELE